MSNVQIPSEKELNEKERKRVRFIVLENNRPACYPLSTEGWDKYPEYDSFDAALQYAMNWLGSMAPRPETIKLGKAYDYNGYGDKILIAEVKK